MKKEKMNNKCWIYYKKRTGKIIVNNNEKLDIFIFNIY